VLVYLALLACADPGKDKSVATVSPPAPAPEAPVAAPQGRLDVAPLVGAEALTPTGTIGFTGAKLTKSHDGTVGNWRGEVALKDGAVARVWFEVETASVATGIEKLDNHLRSADFFDVAAYPYATFVSSAITAGAPADSKLPGATHTVEGDLTLRGVPKRISFPAALSVSDAEVVAKADFVIDRKQFGIVYPGKPDDLIKDEVNLRIEAKAPRGAVAADPAAPASAAPAAPAAPSP